ncbi:hypothetical protein SAMN04244573_04687, partial [Azotobacter beijerinckii]
ASCGASSRRNRELSIRSQGAVSKVGFMERLRQFHLVGHRASDGSLIYSNALLIDALM